MKRAFLLILALACSGTDDTGRFASESAPMLATIDSLTVTDSIGLPIGGSSRIRIAYWARDRMVYCAMATLSSVRGVEGPIITDERGCNDVQLLAVDSVRFENGPVIAPHQLRDQTSIRIEPRR